MHHSWTRGLAFLAAPLLTLWTVAIAQAAELVGRAVLPADTFAPGPTSGQLIGNANNRTAPFVDQQPVQGFSAVLSGSKPGTYYVMSDNGFGGKANSPDALLRVYAVKPDFLTQWGGTGQVFPVNFRTGRRLPGFTDQSFLQLNDANQRAGFTLVADQTNYPNSSIPVDPLIQQQRLLTGGDFDIESIRQVSDGSFWFGDEFGPFLFRVSPQGQLLEAPIQLPNFLGLGGQFLVQSPDSPFLAAPNTQNLRGSRGFEGMALNASGTRLYAMLEGALIPDPNQNRLLINEFDLKTKQYTGRVFFYRLEDPAHAIGDLSAINDREFVVIERDGLQGDPNNPAFANPAKFKRIYKINLRDLDIQGFVKKELLVDLLNIADPHNLGGNGTTNGVFTFPFVTIEDVLPINPLTLLVINDNNYPFSVGRTPGEPDDSEFILVRLDKPLRLVTPLPPIRR
jgi:hypothetical protein